MRSVPEGRRHPGLSDAEIQAYTRTLPGPLPFAVAQLLQCAGGFDVPGGEPVDFTGRRTTFDFPELIPHPVPVATTITGNHWVVDVTSDGQWGPVFYVCHDPPVLSVGFDTLGDFILCAAHSARLRERARALERTPPPGMSVAMARRSADSALSSFLATLTTDCRIFDWRAPGSPGVERSLAWSLDGWHRRDGDRLIFAIRP